MTAARAPSTRDWSTIAATGRGAHALPLPTSACSTSTWTSCPASSTATRSWSARRPAPGLVPARRTTSAPATCPWPRRCATQVARRTGERPTGPIRLLTHPRYWGYVLQPGQFLLRLRHPTARPCAGSWPTSPTRPGTSGTPTCSVPWRDSTPAGDWRPDRAARSSTSRPFMEMDMEYRWLLRPPGDSLLVSIENHDAAGRLFRRHPLPAIGGR